MTIGIGGWGSRRKPMSLVRAHRSGRRSEGPHRRVATAGPDVGLLCAAGKVKKVVYGFVSLDSIPLEPHFRAARQAGAIEALELDEGMLQWGLYAAALRLPFLPTRAGLGADVAAHQPVAAHRALALRRRRGARRHAGARARRRARAHEPRRRARQCAVSSGPDPYFDDLFCMAAKRRFVSCERVVATEELADARARSRRSASTRMMVDGVVEAPRGAALHRLRARLPPRRGGPARVRRERAASRGGVGRVPGEVLDVDTRLPPRGGTR